MTIESLKNLCNRRAVALRHLNEKLDAMLAELQHLTQEKRDLITELTRTYQERNEYYAESERLRAALKKLGQP